MQGQGVRQGDTQLEDLLTCHDALTRWDGAREIVQQGQLRDQAWVAVEAQREAA